MNQAQEICRLYETWKSQRANFDETYQEIIDHIDPHHRDVNIERSAGERKNWKQFDGTALYASQVFADFYQGSVFNQGVKWFGVRHRESWINEKPDNIIWLNQVRDISLQHLRHFYGAGGQAIGSWALFGNGPVLVEEISNRKPYQARLKFTSIPWGQYVMAEGEDGKVDKFIRCIKMPAYQIVDRFGEANVSDEIGRAANSNHDRFKMFDILHSIMPRELQEYSKSKLKTNKEYDFSSCWVEAAKKKLLKESGYRKFPVAVARYKLISGEIYARGLGEVALANAKSMNLMVELALLKGGRELDPPMLVKRGSIIGGILNMQAKGKTVVSDINNSVKPLFERSDWPAFEHLEAYMTDQIMRVFHVKEILDLISHEAPEQTAFQINARLNLLQQILGPVFGQNDMDFFNPVLDLTLDYLADMGLLPDAPDDIAQADTEDSLDFVYEGPLARAQRNQELVNIQQSVADLGGIQPFYPEAVKIVDWQTLVRRLFEIRGTHDLLLNKRQFADQLEQLMAQQQTQQAMQLIAGGAETLGKAAPGLRELRESAQGRVAA